MVTGKTIAEYVGVSQRTISNVVNGRPGVSEETRKRILKAIDKFHIKEPTDIGEN